MNKKNILLIIILFSAFILRIWGVDYGLPNFFIGDEQPLVFGALKMAELKTLFPVLHPDEFRPLYYPPLMSYFYLIFLTPILLLKYLFSSFSGLADFSNYLILNPGFIWLIARIINVFIGVAAVYLIYLIGKKIFNQRVGLLSALFLSLSFFHIQLSHFARHWAPAIFFTYLVVYFAFCVKDLSERKHYLLAGLFAGLAFGVSYITIISVFLFILIHFLNSGSFKKSFKDKNLWLALIVFLIVAIIFILLHPQEFIRLLFGEDSTAKLVKSLTGYLASFGYYFKTMLFYEPAILIFSLWGGFILWLKTRKLSLVFIAWPVIYVTLLYFLFHHEARYISLMLPWFCLLSGYGLFVIIERIKSKPAMAIIICLVFVYPLIIGLKYDYLLARKDARILAVDWINQNISAGSKIITDWSAAKLLATKESLLKQKSIDEKSLRTDDRVLLGTADNQYPAPAFNVLPLHFIGSKLPGDLSGYVRENGYQYFVVEYWQKQNLTNQDKSIIRNSQLIKKLGAGLIDYSIDINNNVLEPVYSIFKMERLGPMVEIYKLRNSY